MFDHAARLSIRDLHGKGTALAAPAGRSPSGPPVAEDFARLADPFRRELLTHCYQMVGSIHEAEDLVQETYLLGWRAFDAFEGRSSLRTWLYRIATRVCLRALERSARRPLPSGLCAPDQETGGPLGTEGQDVPWLQPLPTGHLGGAEPRDPAAVVEASQHVRLAFIAALQYLAPRQRAVLIFRDVLAWRADEVAELLDTTVAAVNSALQRARAQLARVAPKHGQLSEPSTPETRRLLDRYATAFEAADVDALVQVLQDDAGWEMPPYTTWFVGRHRIGRFLAPRLSAPGDHRMVPISANGQPAFALYQRGLDGNYHPHALQVLGLGVSGVARVVAFHDSTLFPTFGLPAVLAVAAGR